MDNPFRSKEFRLLKAEWYDLIEREGFIDIEYRHADMLKQHDSLAFDKIEIVVAEMRAHYYNTATSTSSQYEGCTLFFNNLDEQAIWKLHSDGISVRDIAVQLALKTWIVHNTIQKFKALFGLIHE